MKKSSSAANFQLKSPGPMSTKSPKTPSTHAGSESSPYSPDSPSGSNKKWLNAYNVDRQSMPLTTATQKLVSPGSGSGPLGGKSSSSTRAYYDPLSERQKAIYRAKLSEQAENYTEMMKDMKYVILECERSNTNSNGILNDEERSLLSVAYKNSLGSRRAAWRKCLEIEKEQKEKGYKEREIACAHYRETTIGKEISEICDEFLYLIQSKLLPNSIDAYEKVFYLKSMGDYLRYRAEITGHSKNASISSGKTSSISKSNSTKMFNKNPDATYYQDETERVYFEATQIAMQELSPIDSLRLGLALNFSVFFYEVRNRMDEAVKIGRMAFEDAITNLDSLDPAEHGRGGKDPILILQLIRDNITTWTSQTETSDNHNSNDPMRQQLSGNNYNSNRNNYSNFNNLNKGRDKGPGVQQNMFQGPLAGMAHGSKNYKNHGSPGPNFKR